jgi:hypothetical protein
MEDETNDDDEKDDNLIGKNGKDDNDNDALGNSKEIA